MDRYEAREAIVQDLEDQGYLVKVEEYTHSVGVHERCHHTVEPLIKQQCSCGWRNWQSGRQGAGNRRVKADSGADE